MITKEVMIESFLSLLDEMSPDKITVKDICARSGLTRNTFYYHFSCMESLVDAAFGKVQSDCRAECSPDNSSLAESIACTCRILRQNRRKILHLYHSRYQSLLLQRAAEDAFRLLYPYIRQAVPEETVPGDAVSKITSAYAFHLLGIFQQWIHQPASAGDAAADFLRFYEATLHCAADAESQAAS